MVSMSLLFAVLLDTTGVLYPSDVSISASFDSHNVLIVIEGFEVGLLLGYVEGCEEGWDVGCFEG